MWGVGCEVWGYEGCEVWECVGVRKIQYVQYVHSECVKNTYMYVYMYVSICTCSHCIGMSLASCAGGKVKRYGKVNIMYN